MGKKRMGEKRSDAERVIPAESGRGGKRGGEFPHRRAEPVGGLQESRRPSVEDAQLETDPASEFSPDVAAIRLFPDVVAAYQEWNERRFEMTAEPKFAPANAREAMEAGAQRSSKGPSAKDRGVGGG